MSKTLTTLLTLFLTLAFVSTSAADIWDGPSITFTKGDFVDETDPANQDFLTPNVIITRGDFQGIFNIAQEGVYQSGSPADTEWAFGTTADIGSLTFQDWDLWHGLNPLSTLGQEAVLHLISEDIYIDIMFTAWTQGGGGGFSYIRSTQGAIPEPAAGLILIGMGSLLVARRRR